MQLSQFILEDMEHILQDWEEFAHSLAIAKSMDSRQLRNHAKSILHTVARDLMQPQTALREIAKSKGQHDALTDGSLDSAAQDHAVRRLEEGFSLPEMVSEYRALRASVIRRWRARTDVPQDALDQIVRFSEAIDQSLTESIVRFSAKVDRSRELFMGALGHDLRGSIQVILSGARYLKDPRLAEGKREEIAGLVNQSAQHMHRIIEDLLDIARTKLGSSLPINLKPSDATNICNHVVAEMRAQNPDRVFQFRASGDLKGLWDAGRIEQLLSNLVSNAVQHGDPNGPIELFAVADDESLTVRVHNEGRPIPEDLVGRIFEPLVHVGEPGHGKAPAGHMGLGLYIARTVAQAHGGSIRVQSSEAEGTTFEVSLPRTPTADAVPHVRTP